MTSSAIVQKLWNYCNVLRDDGMSYGDYVEQLTYLLFLKMADERSKHPYNQKSPIPSGCDWQSLLKKDGNELFDHYRNVLKKTRSEKGTFGFNLWKVSKQVSVPGQTPQRWRAFDYEELINRDKASLDIFWLKDESLEESDNLPEPNIIAHEIVEDLEAALEQFREITEDLGENV